MAVHVYVRYDSIQQLLDEFRVLNFYKVSVHPTLSTTAPNFVIIDPSFYFGTYGGIVTDSVLQSYRYAIHETHSTSDTIGYGLNIVWWNLSRALVPGDVHALQVDDGRVAVTPRMWESIRINTIRRKKPARSSYYTASKAWTMKATSSSNSDVE